MHIASPLAALATPRMAFTEDGAELMFLPGGGHIATRRVEHAAGLIELIVECFDRHGHSGGCQTAFIEGARLPALA